MLSGLLRRGDVLRNCGLVLVLNLAGTCLAQVDKPADLPGIAVGQPAPDFILNDPQGKPHSLKEAIQKTPHVALVFYRSADW